MQCGDTKEYLLAGVVFGAPQTGTDVMAASTAFAIPNGAGGTEAQGPDGSMRCGNNGAASGTAMASPAYPSAAWHQLRSKLL